VDFDAPRGATLVYLVALDALTHYDANKARGARRPELEFVRRLGTEPGTALVSENFALMHGTQAGDTIRLRGADGWVPLRVIGTIVDYSWNRGTVYVHHGHHVRAFGLEKAHAFDVYLPPSADAQAAQKRIAQSPLGAEYALVVLTHRELREQIQSMLQRLYGLAYTQEAMVSVVAALGVVTALLISVLQRRRELGLLRAVGATQAQVLRSVLAEALLMGLFGTLIGLAMGIPLEWYAVRVILFEESGFLFPIGWPWREAVAIAALAVAMAVLAGLLPAAQAVRLRIPEAIAYE
jgi:putative ABC transport system permease protein